MTARTKLVTITTIAWVALVGVVTVICYNTRPYGGTRYDGTRHANQVRIAYRWYWFNWGQWAAWVAGLTLVALAVAAIGLIVLRDDRKP